MKPYVIQGMFSVSIMPTFVKGHLTFKYIEGPERGKSFNASIDQFELKLPEDQELMIKPNNFFSNNDEAMDEMKNEENA